MRCCPQLPSTACHSMPRHSQTCVFIRQSSNRMLLFQNIKQPKVASSLLFLCTNVFVSMYLHFARGMFNCSLTQMSNQPITWQQVNELRCVRKTTWWKLKPASEWRINRVAVTLNGFVGATALQVWVLHKLQIYWDFHHITGISKVYKPKTKNIWWVAAICENRHHHAMHL